MDHRRFKIPDKGIDDSTCRSSSAYYTNFLPKNIILIRIERFKDAINICIIAGKLAVIIYNGVNGSNYRSFFRNIVHELKYILFVRDSNIKALDIKRNHSLKCIFKVCCRDIKRKINIIKFL